MTRCAPERPQQMCSWLDAIPNSSHQLKTLISRAKAGIEVVRRKAEMAGVEDSRGPVAGAVGIRPNSYSPELIARLRADYEAGKSARLIAEEYRLDRATMMRHLRDVGVTIRDQGLTDEQAKQAAVMYRSGMTQAQVAAAFGVSQKTAGRYLSLLGVKARPRLARTVPSE
jgi:hypothetical protein